MFIQVLNSYSSDGIGFYFIFHRKESSLYLNDSTLDTFIRTTNYLSQTEKEFLKFIENNNFILTSVMDAMTKLNKSRITIQRTLSSLVNKGKIIRVGAKKNGYWMIK